MIILLFYIHDYAHLTVIFTEPNEFLHFSNYISELNSDIIFDYKKDKLILKLDKDKITKFPKQTKLIVFQLYNPHGLPKNLINFTTNLEHFIISSFDTFDMSILPIHLKILKLDQTFWDIKLKYKLEDFLNLPIGNRY